MPQPGSIGSLVPLGDDWLGKRLRDLQQQIDQLKTAIPQAMASRNFDGTLSPAAAGTDGWALSASGDAIFNNIILRGGIVGDDALSRPIYPKAAHAQAVGFGLTTTATAKATVSISVPAGFTQALVLASMTATAVNSTASQDFFYGYADINAGGAPGAASAAADGAPYYAVGLAHTATALLTGLSGSFTVEALLGSGAAPWAPDAFNGTDIDALVLFLR